MYRKLFTIAALAACLAMGSAVCSLGQENQEKTITSVSLSFSWDKAPKGGEMVGTVQALSSSSQYKVEGAEYLKKDDTWIYGEQPEAEVELSAADGYRFADIKRNNYSLSGCSVQYKNHIRNPTAAH